MKQVLSTKTIIKQDCCGCTACKSICPKQAIKMHPDEDGFLYPQVNRELCEKCQLCIKVCDFRNSLENQKEPLATYAAVLNNRDDLKKSASGGASFALASFILEKKGVVFGCAMDDELQPEHICIDKAEDLKKIQGSKYVQSNLKSTFKETKEFLIDGKQVLFTGTPCQIAGLKSYLCKDYENLITADLICHGVPSPTFFKGYINWLENKLKGKLIDFKFRDKSKGWGLLGKAIYQKGNKKNEKLIPTITSYYYHYFLHGDIYRNSCYKCIYACSSRFSDITLGDYWGVEKAHPEIGKSDGVSVILVNSEKGMELIRNLDIYLVKSTFEQARMMNGQLNKPAPNSDKRDEILKLFREKGFQAVADKYYREMKRQIVAYRVKSMIPQSVKNVIRKINRKWKRWCQTLN